LIVAGEVWATLHRTTSRSAEVRPVAAAAAVVHAEHADKVKAIADLTPGGPAWKRAAKAMHAAYIAAGLD
jgi:hypothetical protein